MPAGSVLAKQPLAARLPQVVMVNSSWTRRHIAELWWQWRKPQRVYPPCDTCALQASTRQLGPRPALQVNPAAVPQVPPREHLRSKPWPHPSTHPHTHVAPPYWPRAPPQALPLDRRLKRAYLVSVAQFRPEKDHALQLRALAAARAKAEGMHDAVGDAVLGAHLKLVGSCRNAEDERRIEELKGVLRGEAARLVGELGSTLACACLAAGRLCWSGSGVHHHHSFIAFALLAGNPGACPNGATTSCALPCPAPLPPQPWPCSWAWATRWSSA